MYDLIENKQTNTYQLTLDRTIATMFRPVLDQIILPQPGNVSDFIDVLQEKLDTKLRLPNDDTGATLADLL